MCWDGTIDVFITPVREGPTVSSPSVATILRDQPDLDTPAPLDRAVRHLAAVTSDLFDQVHLKPAPFAAAA
jgi:hypothetical protein